MRNHPLLLASVLALASVACGGDNGTGPSPSYANIAGTYVGSMIGVSQGIGLGASFSLTLTQNAATIGGSYGLTGTLTDGVSEVDIAGTGTITGMIASGNNPSVNITVHSGDCPARSSNFSGAYDSANHRLTLTGPVEVFTVDCGVFRTYQTTFILN